MSIGVDLGSSSVKALRLDRRGRVARSARRRITTRRAPGDRVEHDPDELLGAALDAIAAVVKGGAPPVDGDPLGIATQRSTVLFWDRDSGRPLTPAYSWQDRRGAALCARLRPLRRSGRGGRAGDIGPLLDRTGLRLSAHYSATKLAWALRHVRGLRRRVAAGRALWGTLGTFVLWRLSGGAWYGIDHANAQRTLLFDLGALAWDADLFTLFGLEALLDAPALPALVPTYLSGGPEAMVAGRRLRALASTGDQQAALIGLRLRRPGDVAINYGSGAFVLENVGAEPRRVPGLLTTLLSSWSAPGPAGRRRPACEARYAVEGPVNAAATAIDWAQRRLGLRVRTADLDRFLGPDDGRPRRVHFLPAISGLGAPRWDAAAKPRFRGDVSSAGPRDLLRAVVESIAMRCAEILRAAAPRPAGRQRAAGPRRPPRGGAPPILVAGGLTRCHALLQAQADLLQRPLIVLGTPDATGVGAALMAARGADHPPVRRRERRRRARHLSAPGARVIAPRISRDEAERRYRDWESAVYR